MQPSIAQDLLLKNHTPSLANYVYLLLITSTRPSSELQLVSASFRCAQSPAEVRSVAEGQLLVLNHPRARTVPLREGAKPTERPLTTQAAMLCRAP